MRLLRSLPPVAIVFAMGALPVSAEPGASTSSLGASAAPAADVDGILAKHALEESTLTNDLRDAKAQLEAVHQRITVRGRMYYRLAHAGFLPIGSGFDALVDHMVHIERMRRALARDLTAEASMMKRAHDAEARLGKVRAERAPLEAQRDALRQTRASVQQAAERRSAFARAFETSERPPSVAIYGTDYAVATDNNTGFRSMKGRLPFPVAGRAEVMDARRTTGPGLALLAPAGSVVRSVAAGRVAFADRYDSYGLTLILDHGDHYFSLYANLGTVDVSVGDSVAQAARLGSVGAGEGEAPHLYFEIHHSASTVDPRPWLGL